jgi:hypothetical protein
MIRPDQKLFDELTAPLTRLDECLVKYCSTEQFTMELNPYRQPGRVLRRGTNPVYVVDIFPERHWLQPGRGNELKYSVGVCAYLYPKSNPMVMFKISKILREAVSVDIIVKLLSCDLQVALQLFTGWTPKFIAENGEVLENLRNKSQQGGCGGPGNPPLSV